VVVEPQLLVGHAPDPASSDRLDLQRFWLCVRLGHAEPAQLLRSGSAGVDGPFELRWRSSQGHAGQGEFVEHHLAQLAGSALRQRLPAIGVRDGGMRPWQHACEIAADETGALGCLHVSLNPV
jgi:hypothetical protein